MIGDGSGLIGPQETIAMTLQSLYEDDELGPLLLEVQREVQQDVTDSFQESHREVALPPSANWFEDMRLAGGRRGVGRENEGDHVEGDYLQQSQDNNTFCMPWPVDAPSVNGVASNPFGAKAVQASAETLAKPRDSFIIQGRENEAILGNSQIGSHRSGQPEFGVYEGRDDQIKQEGIFVADVSGKFKLTETTEEVTTFMISGIQQSCTTKDFREQLTLQGLEGTFDFFHMPCDMRTGTHMRLAIINIVDTVFAERLHCALNNVFPECSIVPAQVQGYKACMACFHSKGGNNSTQVAQVTRQIKQQLHKTKMCAFFMKNRCAFGEACSFAHSPEQLQYNPDLTKTRLCYGFFRKRCSDKNCRFAHGYQELRATQGVYKTELCQWLSVGWCRAGSSCRYAHTVEELRVPDATDAGPNYNS